MRSLEPMDYQLKGNKRDQLLGFFDEIWGEIFSSPIHLDSALSKRAKHTKSILAQILPKILRQPNSLAEALGVGVAPGEPWSIPQSLLAKWRPAHLMAEKLYQSMSQGLPSIVSNMDDFPSWMVEEWRKDFGEAVALDLAQTLGQEAPLSLRVSREPGPQIVLEELKREGKISVRAEISSISPFGIRLSGYAPVLSSQLFERGAFEIQDEGSQMMALFALFPEKVNPLLQAVPGIVKPVHFSISDFLKSSAVDTVVDACAGAGGKTLAIADLLHGKGRIFSYDISEKKIQALRRRVGRSQLNNVKALFLEEGSESEQIKKFHGQASHVLVDAPCSGWGVLRRNPDIKWRQSTEALSRMPSVQFRLLSIYSALVAPGGRLTYGVCTYRKSETLELVKAFLDSNPYFEAREGGFLGPGPVDGFFMQSFIRKK